jgi:hypothetical protein
MSPSPNPRTRTARGLPCPAQSASRSRSLRGVSTTFEWEPPIGRMSRRPASRQLVVGVHWCLAGEPDLARTKSFDFCIRRAAPLRDARTLKHRPLDQPGGTRPASMRRVRDCISPVAPSPLWIFVKIMLRHFHWRTCIRHPRRPIRTAETTRHPTSPADRAGSRAAARRPTSL